MGSEMCIRDRSRWREDVFWWQRRLLTVGRPSVQARKRRGRFIEECHLIRQRLVDFIAQFDGFVSIDPAMDSFSVLVKRVFVALPKVARFIAKCFESLVD